MDETAFWQQKLVQFFHDPPGKPYASYSGSGGHKVVAGKLFRAFTGVDLKFVHNPPDWAAAGADRPMLYVPWGKAGRVTVHWPSHPCITHPLAPGWVLDVRRPGDEGEARAQAEARKVLTGDLFEQQMANAGEPGYALPEGGWNDPQELRIGFVRCWRRFRDELIMRNKASDGHLQGDPLWEEMPTDSRCPDHSIWDHLKVTTALAFMRPHRTDSPKSWVRNRWQEGAQAPWMLRVELGPVQSFIAEARSSRDLWIGSFLLADLAWHAMLPIVRRYGPDSIVYPELRANPRADLWLADEYPDSLPAGADPSSFAALLPATFVALVPRGGAGHLAPVEELAKAARASVEDRWHELAGVVRRWLQETLKTDQGWGPIWDRQHRRCPVHLVWVAVPWLPMGHLDSADSLRGRALPVQEKTFRMPVSGDEIAAQDHQTVLARAERLAPWVPCDIWARYQHARDVYAHAHLAIHQIERGFDYALTHHQLRVRLGLRKATSTAADDLAGEGGEKCTVCGRRQALTSGSEDTLDRSRAAARALWKTKALDPDEEGTERLCGVCAMKRFLVEADQGAEPKFIGSFNRLWIGPRARFEEVADEHHLSEKRKIRVPFPSTATVAAQKYLAWLVEEPRLEAELAAVVAACRNARRAQTSFPRVLPRLAQAHHKASATGRAFLLYEAEDVVFPEALEGKARGLESHQPENAESLKNLIRAVRALRGAARKLCKAPGGARGKSEDQLPGKQIAVIRLDGDRTGRLLLGDAEAIGARWRDVIHPEAVEQIKKSEWLMKAGWGNLLEAKRLMGPSLHAFISRALAHFSHSIVPWVVEQEFSGRLIYAGGDDVLCLAPADGAFALAARLQQLYSAAWVIDTAPSADPWAWRRRGWEGAYDPSSARRRFAIPRRPDTQAPAVRLPVLESDELEAHASGDEADRPAVPADGLLLPMLGANASLSAGIAIGHYKTPLALLLRRSGALLKRAKTPFENERDPFPGDWKGRRALAVGHASRGGEKSEFVLPWASATSRLDGHHVLRRVQDAFELGTLPGRLPYKLREYAPSINAALKSLQEHRLTAEEISREEERLLRGIFRRCLESAETGVAEDAYRVWHHGIRLHHPEHPKRYADGLLLCRALAGFGRAGEEE